ncbi:MAG: 2-phosphosulfolactate phosphatase [Actinomycetota bacterium]|nr:2-phosphosulfolactate phosphatase [Actinomycetota bacterium]
MDKYENRKKTIYVELTNNFNKNLCDPIISNSVCAVIDTLRATSTIAAILESGSKRIILSKNKDEAYKLKKIFKDYLLCGEENGLPPEGFDYGNSPYEFSCLNLSGKKIIMMTTNGTVSFFKVLKSNNIFALSLLNLTAVIKQISDVAKKEAKDIFILCSGKKRLITYDDVYNAGVAVKYLMDFNKDEYILSDSAYVALDIVKNNRNVTKALEKSCSGQVLKNIGYDVDIKYSSKIDKYSVVPVLKVLDLNKQSEVKSDRKYNDIFYELSINKNNNFNKLLLLEDYKKTHQLEESNISK